jgi:hypothetical protein
MPTSGDALNEYLCAVCLQAHLDEPDRYGLVTLPDGAAGIAPPAAPEVSTNFEA